MAYNDLNTHFLNKVYTDPLLGKLLPKSSVNELYPTVANIESIKQGIERLLMTPKGSNPFNREYGSSLYSLLFENIANVSEIETFLYMDITNWEPRISLSRGDISIIQIDKNTYKVNCEFRLIGSNTVSSLSTTITRE